MLYEIRQTPSFRRWLDRLRDSRAQKHIAARIRRMGLGNFGDVKPVGHAVSEMRIDYGPGYRLYFTRQGATALLLMVGGDKSSQKRDIATAIAMAQQIRSAE
ncbi:MAG TPA: type II toxin-antitoxin system RelE/ParE family toxin [Rhizomicrobium sp.]|nr:type II toxin-antitoxin system RelE/ParE family toxin [Rhizomicrobium sp.]